MTDYEIKFAVTDPNEIVELALAPENEGDIYKIVCAIAGGQKIGLCPWGKSKFAIDNVIFDTLCTIMKTKNWSYEIMVDSLKMCWETGEPLDNPLSAVKYAIVSSDGKIKTIAELEYANNIYHSNTFEEIFVLARNNMSSLNDTTMTVFKAVFPNVINQEELSIGEMLFILHAKGYVKDPFCYVDFDT